MVGAIRNVNRDPKPRWFWNADEGENKRMNAKDLLPAPRYAALTAATCPWSAPVMAWRLDTPHRPSPRSQPIPNPDMPAGALGTDRVLDGRALAVSRRLTGSRVLATGYEGVVRRYGQR